MESVIELNSTIEAVFNKDYKTGFLCEYESLMEDIEAKGLTECRVFILANFILFKLYSLDQLNNRRQEILSLNNPDQIILEAINNHLTEQHFQEQKKFLFDALLELVSSLEELNENLIRSCLINQSEDYVNYFISEIIRKKEQYPDNFEKIFEDRTTKNNSKSTNLEQNNKTREYLKDFSEISTKRCSNNSFYDYQCEISYLGGNDMRAQHVVVRCKYDYKSFVYNLKKKLDIYEHAKFKIVLADGNNKVLRNIEQLKVNQINKLKFVPFEY